MTCRRKTLLLGYVGKGNLGDELMVEAVQDVLDGEDCEVISGRVPPAALLLRLLAAKQVVICGGGVVSNRTGSYQRVLFLAKLLGVRRIFFSIEVGGWPRGRAGVMQRWIMRGAKISTRSFESRAIVQQHLPTAEVTDVIDAFYLHPAFQSLPVDGSSRQFGRFVFSPRSGAPPDVSIPQRILVLPRSFPQTVPYSNSRNIARMVQAVTELDMQAGKVPVLISPSADIDVIDAYAQALDSAGYRVTAAGSEQQIELTPETHVITNRLHIAKACAFFSIPNTLVSYDRKTELPEFVGGTGRILRMSDESVRIQDIAMPVTDFSMRRAMSRRVLEEALVQ